MPSDLLRGRDLLEALCRAMDIEFSHVQRIVIDADIHDVARVYVQMIGSTNLLNLDWPTHLKDAKVQFSGKSQEDS